MEALPQMYYDVRTAKLQLECLLEIARAALQPWPKRDSHGRVVHVHDKQPASDDVSGSHDLPPDNNDEMSVKLLDEILAKAQTARDVSKKRRKVNTAKTITPYMESSTTRTPAQRNASAKVGRAAHSVSKGMGGAEPLEKPATIDHFTVEKHGNKVTLPSKWSRLRTAVDKLADDKMEPLSNMEGAHFVQLLQQGDIDPHVNNLLVVKATMDAMIDDVMSISMEQWTVNSRNTWQAIYRVKHHLDVIQQSMDVLRKQMDDIPKNCLPSPSITHHSPLHRLTYSSLKELLDYVDSLTTLQLRLFQLRISQLCKRHFLPTVCDASMTTNDTSTNIRKIYSLVGLQSSPVFLHMTNNNDS